MKKNDPAKDGLENKDSNNHGALTKIFRIFHRSVRDVSSHPLTSLMMLICTILISWLTIRLVNFTFEQPIDQLRTDIAKIVINMRIKIVNINEGCQGNNTYSQVLQQNNRDRLDLMSQLVAVAKGGNAKKNLGFRAQDQLACFIAYNDMLNLRKNICDGGFLTEQEMITWEGKIIYDLYHKNSKKIDCPYVNKKI